MNYSINSTNEIKEEIMAMKEGLEQEGEAETKSHEGLLRKVARAIKWLFSVRQSNDLYTTSYMYRFR